MSTPGRWLARTSNPTALQTSKLYRLCGKRLLDLILASIGLVALFPLFIIIATLIRVTSSGPVFFRQTRVGLEGREFKILKFRSMTAGIGRVGSNITISGDLRITRVGKVLRRWKLDELPQLLNVVIGDMSLVGPRPELPVYTAQYTKAQETVLRVRPGITDPAAIVYRREEEILAQASDPQREYVTRILPHKLALNLDYIATISFTYDLRIIIWTLGSIISSPRVKERMAL